MINAKEYLEQYSRIVSRIDTLKKELADLYRDIVAVKSSWPDGERHVHGTDTTAEQAMKLMEIDTKKLYLQINQKLIDSWRIRIEIINTIEKVKDGKTEFVLTEHYIRMRDYDSIGDDMGYSLRQVARISSEGIEEIQRILSSNGSKCH